ncbi:histidine phosphatase family protein [Microvirgula aerodenitrificans]|uniref:histidine phosphatase family protein n=1 Tax=Microvirgula aerodenitrificans TaxID=57480 RepID=UPI00248D3D74|nr:histidine phosphatase family protein [Microvirgula aerodenitrificans]
MKRITLWRHGEIDAAGLLVGRRSNPSLTGAGRDTMRRGWPALTAMAPVTAMASSPLQRCLASAEDFAADAGLALHVDAGFAETDFGVWDGAPLDGLPADWQAEYSNGRLLPDGGETLAGFRTRVVSAFDNWVERLGDGHAVLITHGGVIAAVLAARLELSLPSARRLFVSRGGYVQLSLADGCPDYLIALANPAMD